MLQITSNTGEINTGPELVQNGSFDQLGNDQVQNGSFAEVSSTDVITDGGFSATGANGVANGNFELGLIGTVSEGGAGTVYTWALNTVVPISGTQDGLFSVTSAGSSSGYPRLGFDGNIELNKSYILTFDYKVNSGTCNFNSINRGGGSSEVVNTTLSGSGTHTYYFVAQGTGVLSLNFDGTELFETQFDNVSIKELGTFWTEGLGWSIGENKANSAQALGGQLILNPNFSQVGAEVITNGNFSATGSELVTNGDFSGVTEYVGTWSTIGTGWTLSGLNLIGSSGTTENLQTIFATAVSRTLRLSYEITNYSSGQVAMLMDGESKTFESANGIYTRIITTTSQILEIDGRDSDPFTGTITNISVKELGEDWTIEEGSGTVTFPNNQLQIISTGGAAQTGITQNILTNNKSYKVTIDVASITGTLKLLMGGNGDVTLITDSGVQTFYLQTATITNATFYLIRNIGDTVNVVLNSVSVKELGEDWLFVNGAAVGNTITIESGGARIISDGLNVSIRQTSLEVLKYYRLRCDITETVGSLAIDNGTLVGPTRELNNGFNEEYFQADDIRFMVKRFQNPTNALITNISVKEVGQNWIVTNSDATQFVEFLGGSARFVVPSLLETDILVLGSSAILEEGKFYKLVVDITVVSGGAKMANSGVNEFFTETTSGTNNTRFITPTSDVRVAFYRTASNTDVTFNSVTVEEISTSYLQQDGVLTPSVSWKFNYTVSNYSAGTVSATDFGKIINANGPVVDFVNLGATSNFSIKNIDGYFVGSVTAVSAFRVDPNNRWTVGQGWVLGDDVAIKKVGTGTLSQDVSAIATEFYRVTFTVVSFTSDPSTTELNIDLGGASAQQVTSTGSKTLYFRAINTADLRFYGGDFRGSITSVVVEQLDPNNYWVVSTGNGASIEFNKAVYGNATIGANFSQSTFNIVNGRTYRASLLLLFTTTTELDWRTSNDLLIGGQIKTAGVNIFDFVGDGSTGFKIQTSTIPANNQQFTGVSVKQLGSYSDQSIYVTVKDRQTISSLRIVYLIELTSLGSLNSLYFIPSSVVASNGRFTKMNFTVVSTDATPQPTLGIISFYDSTGGRDTYPMGFYTYKIYEQTSSTNLDPTLATKQLQQGMAYVHDYLGNMKEVTPPFNEYTPTPIQYIYP